MIRQAALYLAHPEDGRAARLTVAGRPLAFRTVVAAARAGVERVGVPVALRDRALERAIAASPAARAVAVWLDPATPWPAEPTLLLPAAALVPVHAVAALRASTPPAVLGASAAGDAPVVAADGALVAALAAALAAGTPLGPALAGPARVAPAATGAGYARVRSEADARAAEAHLAAALGSPIDTRLDTLVHRRLARPLTRRAVAWGLTPNQITLLSLLVGLGAAWGIWNGSVPGALGGLFGYLLAVVLDHVDGEVARLTLAESPLGAWLDVLADTATHAILVLAMGATTQAVAGEPGLLAGAVAAGGILASGVAEKALPRVAGGDTVGTVLATFGNRDSFYAMLVAFIAALAAAPALLPVLMAVVALGAHGYWVSRAVYRLAKTERKPK